LFDQLKAGGATIRHPPRITTGPVRCRLKTPTAIFSELDQTESRESPTENGWTWKAGVGSKVNTGGCR
jgi:hypothetical protein